MSKRVAILDLGTNTFHLLIAEIKDDAFSIIYKEKIPVKIGKGGINEKNITPEAMQRALDAIHAFAGIIKHMHVSIVKATATSAIRNAKNGQELLKKIRQQTGIEITTISGDEEAEFIYYGVRSALNIGKEPVLVMDIGGGSVEFIIGDEEDILWKRSYEIGAQRLVDKFHKNDPITQSEIQALDTYLTKELKQLFTKLEKYQPSVLIGSSGTFDTLSDIYCSEMDKGKSLNDTEVPFDINYFHRLYKALISKNKEQRLEIPGMIEMRVDMIVVAVILISVILENHNFEQIRVSTFALKEGILFKSIHQHGRAFV